MCSSLFYISVEFSGGDGFFPFVFVFVFLIHLQEFWVQAMFLILFTNIFPFAVAFLMYY